MATTNQVNRGVVRSIQFALTKANNGSSNAITAKLPHGAVVTNVSFFTGTAFDGTGTVTATVTDGTTVFVSAVDVKTTGVETTSVSVKRFPSGGTISAYITDANSNSTTGVANAIVQYVNGSASDTVYG